MKWYENLPLRIKMIEITLYVFLERWLNRPRVFLKSMNYRAYLRDKQAGKGNTMASQEFIDKHPLVPHGFMNFYYWHIIVTIMDGCFKEDYSGSFVRINCIQRAVIQAIRCLYNAGLKDWDVDSDHFKTPTVFGAVSYLLTDPYHNNKPYRNTPKVWMTHIPDLMHLQNPVTEVLRWMVLTDDITMEEYQKAVVYSRILDQQIPQEYRYRDQDEAIRLFLCAA